MQQTEAAIKTTASLDLGLNIRVLIARKGVIKKITGDESPPKKTNVTRQLMLADLSSQSTTRNNNRLAHQNEYRDIPNTSGSVGTSKVAKQINTPPFSQVGAFAIAMQTPAINSHVRTVAINGRCRLLCRQRYTHDYLWHSDQITIDRGIERHQAMFENPRNYLRTLFIPNLGMYSAATSAARTAGIKRPPPQRQLT